MAIVVYQCDTCERTIEVPRQPKGLEVMSRCIITQGCRGKLFQTDLKIDYVRGQFPPRVEGLDDWIQRQALFTYRQTVENDEWVVEHNLGSNPAIQVFVDRPNGLLEIIPLEIEIVDANNTIIRFDRDETGIAQLVSRITNPDILQALAVPEEQVNITQITNGSELTFATLYAASGSPLNANITVDITYVLNNGTTLLKQYLVDDNPSITSPWVNYNEIIFKGRTYLVRSFNIIIPEITNGTISNGASFYFSNISNQIAGTYTGFRPLESIILLANDPYAIADKNKSQFINLLSINSALDATNAFFYNNGELFASNNIIQSVFPPIRQK